MSLLRKSKLAKARKFNYIPKHYDKRKERLNVLLDKGNGSTDAEAMKARISAGSFGTNRSHDMRSASKGITVRVLFILIALIVITYLLLGLYIPSLEAFLD